MANKIVDKEQQILKYWQDNDTFKKSEAPKGDYVFYDGPPFATGLPHYGHLVASVIKDVVPRYWTMKGYRVERRWGWDCHGLPIENIVEKELGFSSKKEIENLGIDKFNETCRSKVLHFAEEWKKTMTKFGRWADMDNPYSTMDLEYMESVWWVFKQLWEKKLVYQDYKSMHVCPRCETTLSQQEVSEGYKDVKDLSVIAKLELVDESQTYLLIWTTTPWTLPGNTAAAVNPDFQYAKVKDLREDADKNASYIVVKDRAEAVFGADNYEVLEEFSGKDLVGKKYKPLFDYFKDKEVEHKENIWQVWAADYVSNVDGTGLVHLAPAFGEEDMLLAQKNNFPMIHHVSLDGRFVDEVVDLAGMQVKQVGDTMSADIEILKLLAKNNKLFAKEKIEHSYPHCWRCDTPLLNYATSSWFVKVTAIKDKALESAKEINWSPSHIKEGRFGKWLEGARDWSISRQRFWASVMPVWQSQDGDLICIGSIKELEELSGQKITDLHKHVIDKVTFEKDGKTYTRIPDVLDTWFDSGSMPYAQMHYPFGSKENQEKFENNFPAEFIAEGVDQTRAWFYYLHILSTAIMDKPAFKNVIVNGIVLAEDGKKMSKKLQNYPDPEKIMDTYGADALRFYLLSSPVMEAENLSFVEDGVKEITRKVHNLVDNIFEFYKLYADNSSDTEYKKSDNILDQWIVAKLHLLIKEVTEAMDNYSLPKATRPIQEFINELSTWYVRRSRDRFKQKDAEAISTLGHVLEKLFLIMAPFAPFMADYYYQSLIKKDSVHLQVWPEFNEKLINEKLLLDMSLVAKIVERGLAARAEAKIKVRQPLSEYTTDLAEKLDDALVEIITDELNIKKLSFGKEKLDSNITPELQFEGDSRELIRQINQIRKENELTIKDTVTIYQEGLDELIDKFGEEIKKATLATEIIAGSKNDMKEILGGKVGIDKK